MANDLLSSVFKILFIIILAIFLIRYAMTWIKTGVGLMRDKDFKGFTGIEFKVAGFLFLLFAFLIGLMVIGGFVVK